MSHVSWKRRATLAIAVGLALGLGTSSGFARAAGELGIRELPVAFRVRNTNTSGVPCLSDGLEYVVRGHLVGPTAAFGRRGSGIVTVYLYGWDTGEWNWALKD